MGGRPIRRHRITLFVNPIVHLRANKLLLKEKKEGVIPRHSAMSYARPSLKPQEALISHEVINIFL